MIVFTLGMRAFQNSNFQVTVVIVGVELMNEIRWRGRVHVGKKISATALFAVGLVVPLATTLAADGLGYLTGPRTIIVNYGEGGAVDRTARSQQKHLPTKAGKNVLVENHPGGAGKKGLVEFSARKPDGHTLLVAFSALVLPATANILQRNSSVNVDLHTHKRRDLAHLSQTADYDLIFTTELSGSTLGGTRLASIPIAVIMRDDHELARSKIIDPQMLNGVELVSMQPGTLMRQVADHLLSRARAKPNTRIEVSSSVHALPLVREGVGVAIMDGILPRQFNEGRLVAIPIKSSEMIDIVVNCRSGDDDDGISQLCEELLEEVGRMVAALRTQLFER